MIEELTGRVAVVTGAASGIGLAMARRLSQEGMSVVLADIEAPRLKEAVESIEAENGTAIGVVTDVSDSASVLRLAQSTIDEYGTVHLLCNNAGVESGAQFMDIPLATWRWVMDVNFYGVVHGVRAFLPLLEQQDHAHIVNTASLAAFSAGVPTFGPYVASKFAILGFSENLYAELASQGSNVGVSVLAPGPVKTLMPYAERNRPTGVPSTESNTLRQELMAGLSATTAAVGLEPSEVAGLVVDAVRANQFFILPHPDKAVDGVRKRLRWMETNEAPGARLAGT